jgi:LacI family transcriptional regulator
MDSFASKTTLAQVAGLAGVSISTASRALSGSPAVATDTVRLVKEAAAKLGYTGPGRHVLEKTFTLGVLVANIASPFFATLIQAIENVAYQHGYHIILGNSDNQSRRQDDALRFLTQKQVDGIIVTPIQLEDPNLQALVESGLPIVQVDRYVDNLRCDVIVPDNTKAVYQAVSFLLEQGYQNIGVISGPLNHSTGRDRLAGYRRALEEAGRPVLPKYIKVGSLTKSAAYQLTSELLDLPDRPDALFTTTLEMTSGALLAIRDHGLEVRRDIGVVVFDEMDYARLLAPPLTTIEQPVYEMGAAAADLLIRRIAHTEADYEPAHILLEARLIVRDSTRPQPQVKTEQAQPVVEQVNRPIETEDDYPQSESSSQGGED